MDHEEGNLFTQDFGITLKDLDEKFELTSYFLSPIGPTHLDKLLFYSLKLHSKEGKYLFLMSNNTGILSFVGFEWKLVRYIIDISIFVLLF